ncbi:hypothetical protein AK812_SmicGene45198, partial [Symbiodinium microadriaticum]
AGALPFGSASAGPALLVGSTNHHLLLMDLPEGRLKQVLHVGNAGEVHALAVHPSSDMQLFATGSSDATIRFWDARDHSPVVGRVLDYTRDQYWWPDGPVPKECTTCCVLEDKAACQFDRSCSLTSELGSALLPQRSEIKAGGNSGGVTQLQVSSDRAFVMSNAKDGQVLRPCVLVVIQGLR